MSSEERDRYSYEYRGIDPVRAEGARGSRGWQSRVESRPVVRRFNETILKSAPYRHAMVIDGNDDRGIDSGIMSR